MDSMSGVAPGRSRWIAALDSLAADALPTAVAERIDGWRLRFDFGGARRANSVLPELAGSLPLNEKIAAAEDFYARHGAPTRFQISPAAQPPELDPALAARGYRSEPGAQVQLCAPNALTADPGGYHTVCESLPSDSWLGPLAEVDPVAAQRLPERARALHAAGIATYFCRVEDGGVVLAVGLGVRLGTVLGLFNMATLPEVRRRGAGTAVVAALRRQAGANLNTLFLQVGEENSVGQAFYGGLGFVTLYRYHYRQIG